MKIAYLDCCSGISGDMLVGAMIDAGLPIDLLRSRLPSLQLGNLQIEARQVQRRGFRAVKFDVAHDAQHAHRHLKEIIGRIEGSILEPKTGRLAISIFRRLAEAEAKVHGATVEKVHFHEVGAVDSIVDIVSAAIGFSFLEIDRVVCSPIPTGTGIIPIAHGPVSVPAPATAQLLIGVPIRQCDVLCELTTPTGAAIAVATASAYGPLPSMRVAEIGVGAGSRDLREQANVMRLLLGESNGSGQSDSQDVVLLETNLDDVSAELIGWSTQKLLQSGALDAYTTSIQMKKNRPACKLTVICRPADATRLEQVVLEQTGTLGIRRWSAQRTVVPRESIEVATRWGAIRGVVSQLGNGSRRFAPEFEDCRELAEQQGISVRQVYDAAILAFYQPLEKLP